MLVSGFVALFLRFAYPAVGLPDLAEWQSLVIGVAVTTVCWVLVTFVTRPTDDQTLRRFYRLVHPGGPGWRPVIDRAAAAGESLESAGAKWDVPTGLVCALLGCALIWGAVLGTV